MTRIWLNGRGLRRGYTTGSCGAAAAKAAAAMFLTGKAVEYVDLTTPKGIALHLEVLDVEWGAGFVSCAIQKDAGDDPDVTDGVKVYAKVSQRRTEEEVTLPQITVVGGGGIGIVTKPGLDQPIGAAAINQTPRRMIIQELQILCETYRYPYGLSVELSVPGGQELAEKTFNPRLGIVGGISILGTTGIVEPMSEPALRSSIRLELRQQAELGRKSLVVTPGNYGQAFLKEQFPLQLQDGVRCSNFVGDTIDFAAEFGMEDLLFVAHIGKFIKVAGGIFQTHSQNADSRMEILTANAAVAGVEQPLLAQLMQAVTTEQGISILEASGYLVQTMAQVMERIHYHLQRRGAGRLNLGAIVFSSGLGTGRRAGGELGRTANVEEIIEKIRREEEYNGEA